MTSIWNDIMSKVPKFYFEISHQSEKKPALKRVIWNEGCETFCQHKISIYN